MITDEELYARFLCGEDDGLRELMDRHMNRLTLFCFTFLHSVTEAEEMALDAFAVVCEGSWLELARGEYRSRLNPHAACQSVLAFAGRYRVPFLFAGSRSAAEYMAWGCLRQYLEGARKRWKAIAEAQGAA